ncbi:MAG: hypothetical protein CND85_02195 [Marine Group II euryarchaeote MED-G33]|nr:MAG: hypothetical protein CND85_02195 [Marine Group II euryarchaeote MED-G33]|tara:strand:- start:2401 stop:2853 length:453 start_codon:yes stop_codon:yes gene_type:complete
MEQRLRWLLLPPAIWISCILLIQVLGGFAAPKSSEMPEQCPEGSQNCSRMIVNFDTSSQDLHSAALDWIQSQGRTSIVDDSENSSHSVFRTKWMMFPDDFFLESGCTENGAWIQIHSESRLGIGDMGVNQNRVDALVEHLDSSVFEVGEC